MVQIVGRLVEQQQFGSGGQGRGERERGALPSGEGAEPTCAVQWRVLAEPAQYHFDTSIRSVPAPRLELGQRSGVVVEPGGACRAQLRFRGVDAAFRSAQFT